MSQEDIEAILAEEDDGDVQVADVSKALEEDDELVCS